MNHSEFTIALICALDVELAAVWAMLDEEYPPLTQPRDDSNTYIYGRIGSHNVVVAGLPAGYPGTISAASVAANVLKSFKKFRWGLMVGVGGGVPLLGGRDVRLGDVVVSAPTNQFAGVVQYDFGKTMQDGHFVRTGALQKPPDELLTAVTALRAMHRIRYSDAPRFLERMAENFPIMQEQYTYQGREHDQLFEASCNHTTSSNNCDECDRTRLVDRLERDNEHARVHYGTIASGNQVMRNGEIRDKIAEDIQALCFEMEAAGLMDRFPCLIIRGICDYADAHKNKRWQPYAAATAAAYAKELLYFIQPREEDNVSRSPRLPLMLTDQRQDPKNRRANNIGGLQSSQNPPRRELRDREGNDLRHERNPSMIASTRQNRSQDSQPKTHLPFPGEELVFQTPGNPSTEFQSPRLSIFRSGSKGLKRRSALERLNSDGKPITVIGCAHEAILVPLYSRPSSHQGSPVLALQLSANEPLSEVRFDTPADVKLVLWAMTSYTFGATIQNCNSFFEDYIASGAVQVLTWTPYPKDVYIEAIPQQSSLITRSPSSHKRSASSSVVTKPAATLRDPCPPMILLHVWKMDRLWYIFFDVTYDLNISKKRCDCGSCKSRKTASNCCRIILERNKRPISVATVLPEHGQDGNYVGQASLSFVAAESKLGPQEQCHRGATPFKIERPVEARRFVLDFSDREGRTRFKDDFRDARESYEEKLGKSK